ncbi:MAG: hypothetical protein PHR35_16795 [Kiritimatiellae bacterium]|nr:hypothetical protein [Kiritimatiellia bacterium]
MLLCLAAWPLWGQTGTSGRRLDAGPLALSIQNEVDAAIRRAQLWLAQRQQPDGSWGHSNRVFLTALTCLATCPDKPGTAPAAADDAAARARLWLAESAAVTNQAVPLEAMAWRELALAQMLPAATSFPRAVAAQAVAVTGLLARLTIVEACRLQGTNGVALAVAAADEAFADAAERVVWLSLREVTPADRAAMTAALARTWRTPAVVSWQEPDAQRAWRLARAINRYAGGDLAAPAEGTQPAVRVDWRHQLARAWIARQRIDTRGGGYWPPAEPAPAESDDATIAQTAFATLLLREL